MEECIRVKGIFGNEFFAPGDTEGKFISVLECGYVILKDGTFVVLSNKHGESLTDFYINYHNRNINKNLTTQDGIMALAQDGLIIYLGTKRDYVCDYQSRGVEGGGLGEGGQKVKMYQVTFSYKINKYCCCCC